MRGAIAIRTLFLPFALAPGCLLPSYDRNSGAAGSGNEAGEHLSGGTAGKGAGGTAGSAGGRAGAAGADDGGARPEGGAAGAGASEAGAGGTANEVELAPREYWMVQGEVLEQSAKEGLLATDRDAGWIAIAGELPRGSDASALRPAKYDADFAIEADGAFRFEPVAEFFGVYEVSYDAENAAGEHASGTLRVYVRPRAVDVDTVADGIGGYAVTGIRDEGFGAAVAAAGDVDGDGFGDFLIGAPEADEDAGAVYLVFGGLPSGSLSVALDSEPDARYVRIAGHAGTHFGAALSRAGDVNGDELADFVVGAPGGTLEDGSAFLFYGRERGGFAVALDDVLEGEGGHVLRGAASENAGVLVAGGDDLTGDGVPDLVIGGQQGRARFYVVDGALSEDIYLEMGASHLFLGAGQADMALALAMPGDVSGNSSLDLLVGTEKTIALLRGPASAFPDNLGAAFEDSNGVLLPRTSPGVTSLSGAGDFDGDGASDFVYCDESLAVPCLIVPNGPDSLASGTQVTGFAPGPVRVAGGGESSGDSFDDLVFAEATRAFVVFGRSTPGPALSLDSLEAQGYTLSGGEALRAVASGGELDRELHDDRRAHYAEWLISDVEAADGAGRVYVLFGEPDSE